MRRLELRHSIGAPKACRLPVRWLLAIVTAHQATASTFDQGVPVLTPYLQQMLGVSLGFAAVVATAGNLGRAIASVPTGRLADRLGGRRVLITAGLVLALLLVAVSLSRNIWMIGCLLVIGGICTASSTPAGSRSIIDVYPPEGRAVPLGVRQTGVPVGGLVAGLSLPLIAENASARVALLALAAIALFGGLLTTILPRGTGAPVNAEPIAGHAPLSSRSLITVASWGAILVVGQFGFLAFALPYLVRVVDHSSLVAAGAIATAQAGAVFGRVWWSWLGTARRRRLTMATLSLAASVAACLMATLRPATPFWLLYAISFGYGCTAMGWNGLWIVVIADLAPPGREASAVGMGLTLVNLASALGPWLLGAAYSLSGSFHIMWLLLGSLLACSLPVALLVPRPQNDARKARSHGLGVEGIAPTGHRLGQLFCKWRPK